jgi:hypothetical protein
MKKPICGDELTIRYQGATLKANCSEVMELPKRGPGAAKFTIVSKSVFHNGGDATLLDGAVEMPVKVERVTSMPQKRIHIVSFYGMFDGAEIPTAKKIEPVAAM